MNEERTTEQLEHESLQELEQPKEYVPRPLYQRILAWILAAVVLFAFLGTCYWLMFFKV